MTIKIQKINSANPFQNLFSGKIIAPMIVSFVMIAGSCFGVELSLNGIVPSVNNANGYGWSMGIPVGGFMAGNDVDMYTGYWEPPLSTNSNQPQIATDALIFPELNSVIYASLSTNIIWNVEKITDDIDGTNLTIAKIDLYYADTTNFILEITNNIPNTLGRIEIIIPEGNWSGTTNYVLKFEVVDSSSLTNSRIFWNNKFVVVPESGFYLLIVIYNLLFIKRGKLIPIENTSG